MYLQPRRPTVFWAASKAAWPAGRGRWFCPSALLWWDPTWSPTSSSGALSTRKTWSCWSGSAWRREGTGETLEQPSSTWKRGYRKDGENLFSKACCDRTRSNGFKLREGRFRLDIRKKFFTMRVVKHWSRLPREVVEAPSLETLQARLDGALSNLVWLKMSLLTAEGLDWMTSKGPFQPKAFYDSVLWFYD